MTMDNPADVTQPEVIEEVASASEVTVDVDTPTFTPETTIETVFVVEEAEAVEAAAKEAIEAASSSEGSRIDSSVTTRPEETSPDSTPSNEELTVHENQIAFQGNDINSPVNVMERAMPLGESQGDPEGSTEIREVRVSQDLPEDDHPSSEISGEIAPGSEEISARSEIDSPDHILKVENDNLNEAGVDESFSDAGRVSATTGHGITSKARDLPVSSPGDGGEPSPVVGDLSTLRGPGEPSDSESSASEGTKSEDADYSVSGAEVVEGEPLSSLEDLSITALVGDPNESDESSGEPPPPIETDQGEGVSPMNIDPQRGPTQFTSQQAGSTRGGSMPARKKKSEFGEKLGSFAKGVAQVGLSAAGEVIPGASVLDNAMGGALSGQGDEAMAGEAVPESQATELGEEVAIGIGELQELEGDPDEGVIGEVINFTGTLDSQLETLDMQNSVQQVQQYLTMMSQLTKVIHDASMSVIRNMGDGSDDESGTSVDTPESDDDSDRESPGGGEMQVQSGLRVKLDSSRSKTTTSKSFSDVAASGLLKAADAVLSAGSLAAPYIPGGSVLSAAISGLGQTKSSIDEGGDEDSEETYPDQTEDRQEGGEGGSPSESEGIADAEDSPLEGLLSDPESDVSTFAYQVMKMAAADMEQDLKDIADKIEAMNDVKSSQRELIGELKTLKSEAAKALREQYHAQEADPEVTFSYTTLDQTADGENEFTEKSTTLPRGEADELMFKLEELAMGDADRLDLGIEGAITVMPLPLMEVVEEVLPIESPDGGADSNEGVESSAILLKNLMEIKNELQEEIVVLKDELMNWPGDQAQTITYSDVEKQSDGQYKKVTKKLTMTKTEVEVLIDYLEQKVSALTDEIKLVMLSLKSAKEESDSTTETLGKTAEKQSGTVGAVAKKP
jgi:hypothetical protein